MIPKGGLASFKPSVVLGAGKLKLLSSEILKQLLMGGNWWEETVDRWELACVLCWQGLCALIDLICRPDVTQRVIHVAAGQEKWSKMGLLGGAVGLTHAGGGCLAWLPGKDTNELLEYFP